MGKSFSIVACGNKRRSVRKMSGFKFKNNILNISILLLLIIYLFYGAYPKHGDFWAMNYVARSAALGSSDFYSDIIIIQKLPSYFVAYPPDWYLFQGMYLKISGILFSYDWNAWSGYSSNRPWFMPLVGVLPNILTFFFGGLLIYKIYPRKELILLYLISPLAFISIEIMGQMDVYPTFFTLLALFFAKKSFDFNTDKFYYEIAAVISLGIGAQFKLYPLILLIPLVIFLANKNIMLFLAYTVLGVVVGLAPWLMYLKWFSFIVMEGESAWLFSFQLGPLNLNHIISVWLLGYIILLWIIFRFIEVNFRNLIGALFLITSWFFITVFTQPQWWIWLLPISIFTIAEFKEKIFWYLFALLNIAFIAYPMMWSFRNYGLDKPISGNSAIILVSIIVSILIIWSFELIGRIIISKKTV